MTSGREMKRPGLERCPAETMKRPGRGMASGREMKRPGLETVSKQRNAQRAPEDGGKPPVCAEAACGTAGRASGEPGEYRKEV